MTYSLFRSYEHEPKVQIGDCFINAFKNASYIVVSKSNNDYITDKVLYDHSIVIYYDKDAKQFLTDFLGFKH